MPKSQLKKIRSHVVELWGLLPAVCAASPRDIPTSFPRLAGILDLVMEDSTYPELLFPIITGLHNLAKGLREKYGR